MSGTAKQQFTQESRPNARWGRGPGVHLREAKNSAAVSLAGRCVWLHAVVCSGCGHTPPPPSAMSLPTPPFQHLAAAGALLPPTRTPGTRRPTQPARRGRPGPAHRPCLNLDTSAGHGGSVWDEVPGPSGLAQTVEPQHHSVILTSGPSRPQGRGPGKGPDTAKPVSCPEAGTPTSLPPANTGELRGLTVGG